MGKWRLVVMVWGCSTHAEDRRGDARRLPELLAAVSASPEDAVRICAPLTQTAVRSDCVLHGVERLAKRDPERAAELCGALRGLGADECHFQLAERSGAVERCADAGRFAEDCRMHAWSVRVPKLADADATAAEWGRRIAAGAAEMGFAASDERPWIAAARHVLGRQLPLDRSTCESWPAEAVAPCNHAGLGLFHDRINHVRDARKWDCEQPIPDLLTVSSDDRELTAVWHDRREELCP